MVLCYGAESPKKALVLLLKEQEMDCSFYNLRGCWIKQIVRFYLMNQEW